MCSKTIMSRYRAGQGSDDEHGTVYASAVGPADIRFFDSLRSLRMTGYSDMVFIMCYDFFDMSRYRAGQGSNDKHRTVYALAVGPADIRFFESLRSLRMT